jgi:hypothetical protein
MKRVAELLNAMRAAGVVSDYALFGAAAQMRYTEAVATLDAVMLVKVPEPKRLDVLQPIYEFCSARGYIAELANRHGLAAAWLRFKERFLE